MKITNLETFVVAPRWLFLKISTDEGISGWGEPVLEGHAETLAAKVKELETFLIGRDPFLIEDTWQMIYRNGCYRGGGVFVPTAAFVLAARSRSRTRGISALTISRSRPARAARRSCR